MKLIILGGGASGLMLASILSQSGANIDIQIIEKLEHVGKKILLTGNGKCNLTNTNIKPCCYNNEIGYEIAKSFDAKKYFEQLGLITSTDSEGRVYPYSFTSNTVLDILRESLSESIDIQVGTNIIRVTKENNKFILKSEKNQTFEGDYLVFATGGKTYYKDCNGYIMASMLSHRVSNLRPSLVSLKVAENLASIENLRSKVKASLLVDNKVVYKDSGEVLYKKDGLSGIVMFQLSSIIARDPMQRYQVELDLLPSMSEEHLQEYLKQHKSLTGLFPKMLNQYVLKIAKSSSAEDVAYSIKHLRFNALANIDFKNAQVTSGGILTSELNEHLMSKFNENLYFIGEVVDVDGACGGYNLQFAFASANHVALDIMNKVGIKNEK